MSDYNHDYSEYAGTGQCLSRINVDCGNYIGVFLLLTRYVPNVAKRSTGASIPIYRWRQMRHGQFWGEYEKSIFWGNAKV